MGKQENRAKPTVKTTEQKAVELQKEIEAEKLAREKEAANEIDAVLKKHNCRIAVIQTWDSEKGVTFKNDVRSN